jgi:protein-disulfide isomerase
MKLASLLVLILTFANLNGCVKHEGPAAENNEENATFAVVNGQEIKGKDVLVGKVKNDLSELARNAYDLKRQATEEIIAQKLLDDEAKKQGTTKEKLLSQFDEYSQKAVSPQDVTDFLKARNIDPSKLSRQERESVPQFIKNQRVYDSKQKFIVELRNKANVKFTLVKPLEKRIEVGKGTIPPNGPESAKVSLIVFSDFECPYCAQGRHRIDDIKAKYKDKVKVYFRNLPLEKLHPHAFHAAEAAACLADESPAKFWDFHNLLFDNREKLDEKHLIEYAKSLDVDEKVFSECLKSGKEQGVVRKDMEEAAKLGLDSTPAFFVNGRLIRGSQPIETFYEVIDEELAD